jgi:hypothetical protein
MRSAQANLLANLALFFGAWRSYRLESDYMETRDCDPDRSGRVGRPDRQILWCRELLRYWRVALRPELDSARTLTVLKVE